MAKIIPYYISKDIKSSGEKKIFHYFEKATDTRDWVVLHSLNIMDHTSKLYGEIDFVVLAPKLGIFCLEVKSGRVKRENGVWYFINRFGNKSKSSRGPFKQAQEGMFSLMENISKKFGPYSHYNNLVFGYGVIFPDILFDNESPEHKQWQIYDKRWSGKPISEFIKKLAYYNKEKVKNCKWFDPKKSLPNKEDINNIVNFLRGDFEKVIKISDILDDTEEQIITFTEEQYRYLDQLQSNPRCLFQGAAGTGKTMLAIESAKRSFHNNERVALFCFNSLLGTWLEKQMYEYSSKDLYVGTFHKFMTKNIEVDMTKIHDKRYFEEDLPLKMMEAIENDEVKKYDKIIIDEGQDLLKPGYMEVFDSLLVDGLKEGRWRMFCDFDNQSIYNKNPKSVVNKLKKVTDFAIFDLTINCRNPRPIGEEISLLCGLDKMHYLPNKIHGLPVSYDFYTDSKEQRIILEKTIKNILEKDINANQITLLSPTILSKSVVRDLDIPGVKIKSLNSDSIFGINKNIITFSTIQGFKGLENSIIVLTDIESLDDKYLGDLLYIGMSRSKFALYVLINKKLRKKYTNIVKNAIGREVEIHV